MDKDKQYELLNDIKNDDGYYAVGGTIYDKDGNVIDSAEETAEAVSQIINK